ncbi:MAG: archaeosortase A [Methanosarcinaceae archaeon]
MMIENMLWIAVALFVVSAIIPRSYHIKKVIGGMGWIAFSLHWAYQPLHYIEINDYFNVILTLTIAVFCLFIAYAAFKEYSSKSFSSFSDNVDVISMTTTATAIGSLFYFPFAQMPALNRWIISQVTENIVWVFGLLDLSVQMPSWNMISYNGYSVEIILACTAIESIALFIGLITAVNAPAKRLIAAFMVSVPVIYVLNIVRDVFVLIAYGQQLFGPNSFEISHNIIAKIGSGIALFVIGYAVMRILPELLDLIDGLWVLTTNMLKDIVQKIPGFR